MPHYFLRLAYDGTRYAGYQWQPGGLFTVQRALQDTLSGIHKREITFGGCGRTDAGVHASQYYGKINAAVDLPENYRFILNKQLPAGIVVHDCFEVPANAHARYDATERAYDYFFRGQPDAFQERFAGLLPLAGFDPARCAGFLPGLLGEHDFRAFCKSPDQHNTTRCTFNRVQLFVDEARQLYRLRFVADRFLRGMIRILAQDLIDLGRGVRTADELRTYLTAGQRPQVIKSVPAAGLFLTGVRYPYTDRPAELPSCHAGDWRAV